MQFLTNPGNVTQFDDILPKPEELIFETHYGTKDSRKVGSLRIV